MRDAVQSFLIQFLEDEAIKRVMKREDTSAIADAHDVINKAFILLKETYADDPKPTINNPR